MSPKKQPTTKLAAKDAPPAAVQPERTIEPSETQTVCSQEEAGRTKPLTEASHEAEVQTDVAADTAELAEEEAWQGASLMGLIYDDPDDAAPTGLHPDPNAAGKTGEVQPEARNDGGEDDIPLVERKRQATEEASKGKTTKKKKHHHKTPQTEAELLWIPSMLRADGRPVRVLDDLEQDTSIVAPLIGALEVPGILRNLPDGTDDRLAASLANFLELLISSLL